LTPARRLLAAALGSALVGLAAWLNLHNLAWDRFESWIFCVPIAL
jgi:hypothetical protein